LNDDSSKKPFLAATDSVLRPGDFPLGSMLSRAAARLRLRARNAEERPVDEYFIIDLRTVPDGSSNAEHVDRYEKDGKIIEFVFPAHPNNGKQGIYSVKGTSREGLNEFLYGNKPWFSERLDEAGNAQRTLHVPPGMSEDEARRILDRQSQGLK